MQPRLQKDLSRLSSLELKLKELLQGEQELSERKSILASELSSLKK